MNKTIILIFRYLQCLHLMYSEVAWVLVFLGTQVQPQIILEPDHLPDHLPVSYDYDQTQVNFHKQTTNIPDDLFAKDQARHTFGN